MGSVADFERICRLCGLECYDDLINLYEAAPVHERNLVAIIKKYVKVTVAISDSLPHNICGPCLAKLDEVVEFVDASHATQLKLKKQLKGSGSGGPSQGGVLNDRFYELIQDVKVELEEQDTEINDDINDEDYGPKKPKGRAKGTRGRPKAAATKEKKEPKPAPKVTRGRGKAKAAAAVTPKKAPAKTTKKGKKKEEPEEINEPQEESTREDGGKDTSEEGQDEEGNSSTGKEVMLKNAVRCGICMVGFSQPSLLPPHSVEVHQEPNARYLCPQCPRVFPRPAALTNHQRKKHQDALQGCPQCHKHYPSHYLWTRHMLVHTNNRPFECEHEKCGKKFKSKAELLHHKKTHRPDEERYTHCCEVCGKRFTQKANLDTHLRLHTGERPFSCEFCGKGFYQRGNMEEHRRIHTGEKPFVCELCGVRYSRQGQLTMHRKRHTGEKPHKCQYCNKEFIRREVMRQHENIHTDTRPFKCRYCEKYFRDQGKRKVHERLHTGERPFECKFCGRGFCESGNLRKHMQVHIRRPETAVPGAAREKNRTTVTHPPTTTPATTTPTNHNPSSSYSFPFPGLNVGRHSAASSANATNTTSTPSSASSSPATSYPSFPFPGLSIARHGGELPNNPNAPNASQASAHAVANSHGAAHSLLHGGTGSIPVHGGMGTGGGGHPLVTLRPIEDNRGRPSQSSCEANDYRVPTGPPYPPVPWALYHS